MFAVDGKERRTARLGGLSHQGARRDQGFLVGERHGLPRFDRRHGRSKARTTDDRGHDEVDIARGRFD